MTLAIYLRDLTRSQAKFLVEVKIEASRGEQDPSFAENEYLSEEQITDLFKEFIEKAKARLPLKSKKVDVWIGMWINESKLTLEFPPEFMALVSQNGWPVTFDLND